MIYLSRENEKDAIIMDYISKMNDYSNGVEPTPIITYSMKQFYEEENTKLDNQLLDKVKELNLKDKKDLIKNLNILDKLAHIIDVKKDFTNPKTTTHNPALAEKTNITFKNLYDMFLINKKEEYPDLARTTWRDYQSAYNDFLFVVANAESRDISSFTKDDFKSFSDALHHHIPKSRTKKQYKDYTYENLKKIELKEDEKLATDTKKKKMSLIRQMFDIAVNSEDIAISENLVIPYIIKDRQTIKGKTARQNKQEARKALSEENLSKLFSSKLYTEKKDYTLKFQPEKFWIPLLATYTGMRQNEICQLKISDIKQEKISTGELVYCFELNEDEDKHLKNENAYRCVPLHPKLIELGFIDYYDSVKNKQPTLWKNLRLHPTEDRYNTDYNKSFMKYFRKYVTKDSTQVFHSLRHNVASQLLNNAVIHRLPKALMNQILGHAPDKDETSQTYSNGYGIEQLYEGIKTLEYVGL
ncbi:site-specific integrase [Sulfurimonas sp.]|uniref:site-specific integrase n=1 Tax=Sulfurimonas sp. TaxID=2022749 RepID=UPI0025D87877|nr:site-specific integrase [Sulfurimonas sp.]